MEMTIQEIANDIGTSKQNVNQILKRSMKKIFRNTQKILGIQWSAFDVMVSLSQLLKINKEKDLQHFFFDFPEDIRTEVILSAKNKISLKDYSLEELLKKDFNGKKNSK